jgi:hypothetical protein
MPAIWYVLILGSTVSAVLALVIVCTPIIAPFIIPAGKSYTVAEEIKNWGGIIIGFYFGSFLTLTADLVKVLLGGQAGLLGAATAARATPPAVAGAQQPQATNVPE